MSDLVGNQNVGFLMKRLKYHTVISKTVEELIWLKMRDILCKFMINPFFSHVETEPPIPGYYQYLWGVNVSCSRKRHTDPAEDRTRVSRASDSGSGDPGSILGRVGVLFP